MNDRASIQRVFLNQFESYEGLNIRDIETARRECVKASFQRS